MEQAVRYSGWSESYSGHSTHCSRAGESRALATGSQAPGVAERVDGQSRTEKQGGGNSVSNSDNEERTA